MISSTKIAQMVSSLLEKGAGRALDKKCLFMTFPPKPLVQIQYNYTELFLMMASFKIAQTVLLGFIQGSPEL